MRTFVSFCLGLVALIAANLALADVDVRVGSGAGCSTASIQTAINNASSANGITNILISRNATYNTNWINITSKNVRLIGGYADCTQMVRDSERTQISGAGGSADSVIKVRGSSATVGFYNLDIVNGDATSNGGHGGGVEIEDGPHALIYFENVWIANNRATEGGGLWIKNEISSNPNDVFVWLSHNTRIYSNTAQLAPMGGGGDGGGIFCFNAKVTMAGSVSELIGSHISSNTAAGAGGGIRAENCVMNIASRHINLGTIDNNTAVGPGGAISVSGENAIVNLYTRNPLAPTILDGNVSGGVGGAIDIGSSARVVAWDVIISNNISRSGGGAVSLFDNDGGRDATFTMQGTLNGAPNNPDSASAEGAAANCALPLRCNLIAFNKAVQTNGGRRTGGAIRATTGGDDRSDESRVALYGTEVVGNWGENLIEMSGDDVIVDLNGVALLDSSVTDELLHAPDDLHHLRVNWSTIAGNVIGGSSTFRSSMDGSAANAFYGTQFKNSIHWQPGKRIYSVVSGTVNANNTDYLLSNDLAGVPISTHNLVANPQFINSAAGDYRLGSVSPAVDYASADATAPTADHLPRLIDLSSVSNEFGAQDLGAYERQFACAEDSLFCNGFE